MDKILIQGLELQSLIGVFDWERTAKQRLVVDLEMYVDLSPAAESDNIEHTVSYAEVAECLDSIAHKSEFFLLEALAQDMIDAIFSTFPISKLSLRLSKPDILAQAQNVAIEMTRER